MTDHVAFLFLQLQFLKGLIDAQAAHEITGFTDFGSTVIRLHMNRAQLLLPKLEEQLRTFARSIRKHDKAISKRYHSTFG